MSGDGYQGEAFGLDGPPGLDFAKKYRGDKITAVNNMIALPLAFTIIGGDRTATGENVLLLYVMADQWDIQSLATSYESGASVHDITVEAWNGNISAVGEMCQIACDAYKSGSRFGLIILVTRKNGDAPLNFNRLPDQITMPVAIASQSMFPAGVWMFDVHPDDSAPLSDEVRLKIVRHHEWLLRRMTERLMPMPRA